MKYIYSFILASLLFNTYGQVDEVSVGSGYSNMSFYDITSGEVTSYAHNTWDIAFSVFDDAAGVFVNEAIASSMTQVLPEVELYSSSDTDFETADTTNIIDRLYNEEETWSAGAFNRIANEMDPNDMGWGMLNGSTGEVEGSAIYFIKLRDDSYHKLMIQSLANGTYTFKYADLDGANEVTETISKSDFNSKTLAYYSFADQTAKDLEPDNWDLLFTRYTDAIDDGTNLVEYMVTGVLSNRERPVAVADGVDPGEVDFNDYLGDFENSVHIIGHDWKYFDLGAFQWVLATDRVYFVRTDPETIWQLLFIDFSGSFSGITTLEKTLVFNTAVTDFDPTEKVDFWLAPNPAKGEFFVHIDADSRLERAKIRLINASGQIVQEQYLDIDSGKQAVPVNTILPAGLYTVQILHENFGLSQKIQIIE